MPIAQMSKKLANFCSNGYFEFRVKNLQRGVKICNLTIIFFFDLVDPFPTYGRSSNFQHWMGGK